MRLPCATIQHERQELAREFHESLYAAFIRGDVIVIPSTTDWHRLQGGLHRFWNARGFRLRGHRDGEIMRVWIERKTSERERKAG